MRRLFELGAIVPVAMILILPVPIIALAIKPDSPGPVFFLQKRVGKYDESFTLIKYRLIMRDAETDGAQISRRNDERITRVGAYLRRTRLDETLQAINVFKGEMALFGPRPERPHVVEETLMHPPLFRMRTAVRSGITGWVQVKGSYVATQVKLASKLEHHLFYIRSASPRMCITVVLDTVAVVFHQKGFYHG